MDSTQFKRLEAAVQWAVDVHDNPPKEGVRWEQSHWMEGALDGLVPNKSDMHFVDVVCDSSCCIAGNVVLNAGDKFVVPEWNIGSAYSQGSTIQADYCLNQDGELESINTRARELLGITLGQSNALFAGENGIDEVINIAWGIANGYGFNLNIIRNRTRKQVLA